MHVDRGSLFQAHLAVFQRPSIELVASLIFLLWYSRRVLLISLALWFCA